MLKKNVSWGLLLTTGLLSVTTACHDENGTGTFGAGEGGISPLVELNTSVTSSKKVQGRATEVTVNDLALTLTKADGSFSKTWSSVADFDTKAKFAIGDYTMEASYGSIDDEGFDKPAYSGSTTFTVIENKETPVTLSAALVNSMVSVTYTDEFKNYMTSWSAELHSAGGSFISLTSDETRPVYLKPGDVSLDVTFTKPNGNGATFRIPTFVARPRYHYHLTVGLGTATGETSLVVTFDENLENEDVTIDLSDEVLNAPAPTISGNGVNANGTVFYVEGSEPEKVALDIFARGEIASVMMTTHSKALFAQGWPAEVDLTTTDQSVLSKLQSLGLDFRGLKSEKSRLGVIDFTQVQTHFREIDGGEVSTFDVQAIDRYGKVGERFTFNISTLPLVITLSNPSSLPVAGTNLELDLEYNGSNAEKNISFETRNERGIWDKAPTKSIEDLGDGKYHAKITVPGNSDAVTVRATAYKKVSNSLEVNRSGLPEYTLTVPADGIWATHADALLSSDEADTDYLTKLATFHIANSGDFNSANVTAVDGSTTTMGGLAPGTKYDVKVSFNGFESVASEPVAFTTESELAIPNGDFESLADVTYSWSKDRAQGGQWSISSGINYQSTNTFALKEATGWATVNAKTTSGSNKNTWFAQPAVFNTGITWSSTVPKIRVVGTGGGTETPASFKGFKVHGGSNAMVVRNVAWSPNGTTPGVWMKNFASASEYYNHNIPEISNTSVGRMFLGSYSYSNGNETFNQGVSFASRPTALKGWYMYTADSHDKTDTGVVTVEVMNGNQVIGTGTASLKEAGDFTEFTVNIKYSAKAPKATAIRVMVASSAKGENEVAVSEYNSRYEAYKHGATLVVDDFSLIY